jgi:hypothetical protein
MIINRKTICSPPGLARLFGAVLLTTGIAASAWADTQSEQDFVPRKRTVPTLEQVKKEVEESRFGIGAVHFLPIMSIRNAGYTSNSLGGSATPTPDVTATIGAGARLIAPVGRKVYLRGQVLPEYIWHANLGRGNTLGGQYDASVLGLFNRMAFELKAESTRQLSVVSSESELTAVHGVQSTLATVEIDLLRRMSLFAGAETRAHRYDYSSSDSTFTPENLNRRDAGAHLGLRYNISSLASISLQAEQASSTFDSSPALRNNQSRSYLAGLRYDLPRSYVHLAAGQQLGTPTGGSQFPAYSELIGSYAFSHSFSAPIEIQIHGNRRTIFAASTIDPYYLETRNGTILKVHVGRRGAEIWMFGDLGANRYPTQSRVDKVTGYGAGVGFPLYRGLSLNLGLTQTDVTSSVPGYDRNVMRVVSSIGWKGTAK